MWREWVDRVDRELMRAQLTLVSTRENLKEGEGEGGEDVLRKLRGCE